jgi:SAM-dependent methyltransferase
MAVSKIEDRNRPPVLAHLRFVAEQEAFSGLDLVARFRRIYQANLWGAASSISGLGSEDQATYHLRRELPDFLRALGASSLLDAPCGDGAWVLNTNLGLSYTGVDIVPELIAELSDRARTRGSGSTYVRGDITCDPLPRADAILCRDCLVHLSFSNIALAIRNFRRSGCEWLVTTTFPKFGANLDCEDGDWRALNFELAPFMWGAPARVLVEGCTEGDGGWADKSLAAWRIAKLP